MSRSESVLHTELHQSFSGTEMNLEQKPAWASRVLGSVCSMCVMSRLCVILLSWTRQQIQQKNIRPAALTEIRLWNKPGWKNCHINIKPLWIISWRNLCHKSSFGHYIVEWLFFIGFFGRFCTRCSNTDSGPTSELRSAWRTSRSAVKHHGSCDTDIFTKIGLKHDKDPL